MPPVPRRAAAAEDGSMSAIEVAIEWLATYLSTGPKTERELRENHPTHMSPHAVNCAKRRLSVVTYRHQMRNMLALPGDYRIPENPSPATKWRSPCRRTQQL
jgi:hypothetical protein